MNRQLRQLKKNNKGNTPEAKELRRKRDAAIARARRASRERCKARKEAEKEARKKLGKNIDKRLDEIDNGIKNPNVRKSKDFENDGRGGTPKLPERDAKGRDIKYEEHTVNPRPPHGKLDEERIITGSDGSVWGTVDHFTTWHRIR